VSAGLSKRSPDERSDIRDVIPAYRTAHAGYLQCRANQLAVFNENGACVALRNGKIVRAEKFISPTVSRSCDEQDHRAEIFLFRFFGICGLLSQSRLGERGVARDRHDT
jgi:hypothetical protein